MRTLDPPRPLGFNEGERVGCCDALSLFIVTARAHPHMPRRRKSIESIASLGWQYFTERGSA